MAEPKKRMSRVRTQNRQRQQKIAQEAPGRCPRCGKFVIAHQTCRGCLSDIKE